LAVTVLRRRQAVLPRRPVA